MSDKSDGAWIDPAEAEALIARVLEANHTSARNARSVAQALVAAESDGQKGHGFSRVAAYARQARSGKVHGAACPQVHRVRSALLEVDARHGFAFPAIDLAIEELIHLTPQTGIAAAAIRRSHHCGHLAGHVERLAQRGLAALMFANTPKAMAPWGGGDALFGTNPIAFAAPRDGADPLVIDLSLSKVARGKVMAAAQHGQAIPEGWALDAQGRPTTDAKAALQGTMIPAGDAKGAALALIVELLAATLTGSRHSQEASSFFDAEGEPPGVGQLIISFDTGAVSGADFSRRIETLLSSIEAQPGARLPGSRRLSSRREAADGGLWLPTHLQAEMQELLRGDRA